MGVNPIAMISPVFGFRLPHAGGDEPGSSCQSCCEQAESSLRPMPCGFTMIPGPSIPAPIEPVPGGTDIPGDVQKVGGGPATHLLPSLAVARLDVRGAMLLVGRNRTSLARLVASVLEPCQTMPNGTGTPVLPRDARSHQ